ncbi:MAG: helix-turn-helix domain-containing protein [Gammaproteobacteria bacterium]|nr:helix-turn-helix domain-containing protein [Gammaproteobacteria bacterium]MBP9729559.1 helix-turn-helix domain-containing protein [Gammaproteobacteria bacterium]
MREKAKILTKNRLLDEVHETAKGLHQMGLIDKRKMEKYDLFCLKKIPNYSPTKIKTLRKRYHLSQAVLAAIINTSLSTVRQWEIGDKHPSGPSMKLLNILDKKGINSLVA